MHGWWSHPRRLRESHAIRLRLRVYDGFDSLHLVHAPEDLRLVRATPLGVFLAPPIPMLSHRLHHQAAVGHEYAEELLLVVFLAVNLRLRSGNGGGGRGMSRRGGGRERERGRWGGNARRPARGDIARVDAARTWMPTWSAVVKYASRLMLSFTGFCRALTASEISAVVRGPTTRSMASYGRTRRPLFGFRQVSGFHGTRGRARRLVRFAFARRARRSRPARGERAGAASRSSRAY